MSRNTQGVLWALLATALFSLAAAMAKIAVTEYHVLQILFFRQVMVLISTLPSLAVSFPESLKTRHPYTHILRLTGAFIALSSGIWAVSVLPLTTAITLAFSQVLFVSLLAVIFLGESVGLHRVYAVIVGFIGVIVVMRPGYDGFIDMNALIPITGALGAGIAITCVRKLARSESTATLLAYQAVFVGAMAGVPLIWLWITPGWSGFVLLVGMGIVASMANWVGVQALRLGEASVVGNIEYMKLTYAAVLGYVLFDELPDLYAIIGAIIIICSSVYIFYREAMKKS